MSSEFILNSLEESKTALEETLRNEQFLSSLAKGPLPEQLIPKMPVPVELVWGEEDPWEPIKMGREEFGKFDTVRNFVPLPCGHCPMDEAPQLVNPLVESFVRDVTSPPSSS